MNQPKNITLFGATGNQGGAVYKALKTAAPEVNIRVAVRDTNSAKAIALANDGADVVEADFDEASSLDAALERQDAAFLVTTPMAGIDLEIAHGKAAIDAAKRVGLPHLVFSSVAGAQQKTGIPHFDSKAVIEDHLVASGIGYTTIAPVFFMDNLLFPWNLADIQAGKLRQALAPNRKLQVIAATDIGHFVAAALLDPGHYKGQRIEIAGDTVTGEDMAAVLSDALGKPVAFEEQSIAEVSATFEDMGIMYQWFADHGFSVDIAALRAEYQKIPLATMREWAIGVF